MNKIFQTCAAVMAVSLPAATMAQTTGSMPGYYDVSRTNGWEQMPSSDPSVKLWGHTASMNSAGTNCNIITADAPIGNAEYQAYFDTLDERTFFNQLQSAGAGLSEISPIQTADYDGIDAFRITTRASDSGLGITAVQMQAIINNKIIAVTCGALDTAYGTMAPTMERFIDDVKFDSSMNMVKFENNPTEDYPPLVTVNNVDPMESSLKVFKLSAEQSIAAALPKD